MLKSDFYYELPERLIAQTPLEPRDSSRLMQIDRRTGVIMHRRFHEIAQILMPGDLLILNDSRVIPARLYGRRETGAAVQFLLLEQSVEPDVWEVMVRPGNKAKVGSRHVFGDGRLRAEVIGVCDSGTRHVRFFYNDDFFKTLDVVGHMPLPHYIKTELEDCERYQTVYSRDIGSAAAPTAGLHFTGGLLGKLRENGINTAFVTLHVGMGTFRPVKADNIADHKMHSEYYSISQETANMIEKTRRDGGRIIGVGTTSCRTLETAADGNGIVGASQGKTNIFIHPGYRFKALDGLITNFHLPESTLIMLVCAFAGHGNTMNAYKEAVEKGYRFYSFGDAMLIV